MLVAALPIPIVQSVGYPAYAERFPTRLRYTGMTIAGALNDYQQANLVIVPHAQAYAFAVLLPEQSQESLHHTWQRYLREWSKS